MVAASDMSALGALQALADEGLRVPDDVLVTGFDNYPTALSWPALTTVDPEQNEQGRAAAERLLAELDGDARPGEEIVVPSRFHARGSTRSLAPGDPEQVAAVVALARVAQEQLAARDALWGLSYVLSNCATPAEVADALAESTLSRLGIDRCFLAVFTDDPITGDPSGDGPPEDVPGGRPGTTPASDPGRRARVVLNYSGGEQGPAPSEVFPLGRLLPSALRHELRTELLVFQPLSASDRELGYVLFEQGRGSTLVTDWLRTELGRTLEAMFSTQALREHAATLEDVVARRTAELAARSEQLEAEVETRKAAEGRLQQAVGELHRLAMSDGLTQLANRNRLQEHLSVQWKELTRHGGEMALLMIDVDLFKAYNDHYGHMKGDEALRIVAAHLADSARYPRDLACRYGGEEFVLALPGTGLDAALLVAERFRAALAAAAIPHERSPVAPRMTVSIGIAVARPQDAVDPWSLLDHADRALYRAKTQGRDQVCSVALGPTGRTVAGGPVAPRPRSPRVTTDPGAR